MHCGFSLDGIKKEVPEQISGLRFPAALLHNLCLISSSAGEYQFGNGVDLYASMRRAITLSFSFFNILLTVCTALSASPFDWVYLGLLGAIWKTHSLAK